MNSIKRMFFCSVSILTIIIAGASMASAASTSYNADQMELLQYNQSIMPDPETAPVSMEQAGESTVNTASGGLEYSATDLYLPGKGGLDVSVTRKLSTQTSIQYRDELYSVGIGNPNNAWISSEKQIYKYYIGSTSDYVYIYFDNEEQLLEYENGNGELLVGSNFRDQIIQYNAPKDDVYYTQLQGDLSEDIKAKGFIKYYSLPSGSSVTLRRDKTVPANTVEFNSIHAYAAIYGNLTPFFIRFQDGWHFDMDMMIKNGRVVSDITSRYTYYEEYGNFLTRDGQSFNYRGEYRRDNNTEVYKAMNGYIYSDDGDATEDLYSISVDFPEDSMDDYDEREMGFRYVRHVEDYQGKNMYFDYRGYLVAEIDRFGNKIIYDESSKQITDTYGRIIKLPKIEELGTGKLTVNGETVAEYFSVKENNNAVDPNNLLTADDKNHLTVRYGQNPDQEVTYTSKEHQNLYRLQENPSDSPQAYNCDITKSQRYYSLDEVSLSSGAKYQFQYDKANVFLNRTSTTFERLKLKSKKTIAADGTVSEQYTYSYDNPTEGLLENGQSHTSTTVRQNDGYTIIDHYNSKNTLTSQETRAGSDYTTVHYEYVKFKEGNQKIASQTVRNYNSSSPSNYTEETTCYEYNTSQQMTKKQKGDYIETYSFTTFGLPSRTEMKKDDNEQYIRITYTNNGKAVTAKGVYDVDKSGKSEKKSQVSYTQYEYNSFGDQTYDSSTHIRTQYTYLDPADAASNPSAHSLRVQSSLVSNESDNIIDENDAPAEVQTNTTYNLFGNMVSQTDAKGNTTTYEYDAKQRLIQQNNPDGTSIQTEYLDNVNEIIKIDENGNKQRFCYDSLGRYWKGYIYNTATASWILAEEVSYDAVGNIASLVSSRNEDGSDRVKVDYTYYVNGRKKSEILKNSATGEELSRYESGPYSYQMNGTKGITSFSEFYRNNNSDYTEVIKDYDLFGNLVEEKMRGYANRAFEDYRTQRYTYDYQGNMLTVQDANSIAAGSTLPYTIKYEYNALGQIKKATDALGNTAENTYNTSTGLLSEKIDFNKNKTRYLYNAFNQVRQTIMPNGGITKSYYDVNGNQAKVESLREKSGTTELYDTVHYQYDNRNRLCAVINHDGTSDSVTQYAYDPAGNQTKLVTGLTQVQDLNQLSGNDYALTQYEYNHLNQCIKLTDPAGNSELYTYDLFGNILEKTDKNGDVKTYTYTPHGLLKSVAAAKGEDITNISFTYDKFGNRTSMTDETGTTTYEYSISQQLQKETKNGLVKDYTYDKNGNVTRFFIKDAGKTTLDQTYIYDVNNRMTSMTGDNITSSLTYDANGNVTAVTRGGINTNYTYNEINALSNVVTKKDSTVYQNDTYTYYLNGNKKTATDTNNTTTYQYDGIGRLTKEAVSGSYTATYSYDTYGNRLKKTVSDGVNSYQTAYTYNKNNQLLEEAKTANGTTDINRYFYDNNGNQTYANKEQLMLPAQVDFRVQIRKSGDASSYEYDGLNRLTKADINGKISTYTYNGDNLRQSKTVDRVTTSHIYNGMDIVQEKDQQGAVMASYYRAGSQIISSNTGGSSHYYIYNGQGNVTNLLDSNGAVEASYDFDAFGNQLTPSPQVYNPFRYNGEYTDEETGYTYLRARYYAPNTGRFISEDPIRSGSNWYIYCYNSPITFVDPSGLAFTLPNYKASGDDRLQALQALTDDTLDYDVTTGLVIITNQVSDPTRKNGTNLVRELIADPILCTIDYTTDNNSYMMPSYDSNGKLTSAEILYNPNVNFDVLVKTDSGNQMVPETNFIVMGHELVHFYNRLQGNDDNMPDPNGDFTDPNNKLTYKGGTYYVQDEKGVWQTKVNKIEELRTTGITSYRFWTDSNGVQQVNSVSPGKYSENSLRQEQLVPMPIRVQY